MGSEDQTVLEEQIEKPKQNLWQWDDDVIVSASPPPRYQTPSDLTPSQSLLTTTTTTQSQNESPIVNQSLFRWDIDPMTGEPFNSNQTQSNERITNEEKEEKKQEIETFWSEEEMPESVVHATFNAQNSASLLDDMNNSVKPSTSWQQLQTQPPGSGAQETCNPQ
jgi:hypothetical protein